MSLEKCPDCSRDISSSARKCPHCGAVRPWRVQPGTLMLFVALIVLGLLVLALSQHSG